MGSLRQVVPKMPKNVEAQIVEMKVPLYSYGCERKVKKALSHLRGIHSVHVNYELQKVSVWGICNRDVVLETIKKKRRESKFWDNYVKNEKPHDIESEDHTLTSKEERDVNNQLDEREEKEEEEDDDHSPHLLKISGSGGGRHKARKLWKKLFPMVR